MMHHVPALTGPSLLDADLNVRKPFSGSKLPVTSGAGHAFQPIHNQPGPTASSSRVSWPKQQQHGDGALQQSGIGRFLAPMPPPSASYQGPLPAGMLNMGNTCYLNAVLQVGSDGCLEDKGALHTIQQSVGLPMVAVQQMLYPQAGCDHDKVVLCGAFVRRHVTAPVLLAIPQQFGACSVGRTTSAHCLTIACCLFPCSACSPFPAWSLT